MAGRFWHIKSITYQSLKEMLTASSWQNRSLHVSEVVQYKDELEKFKNQAFSPLCYCLKVDVKHTGSLAFILDITNNHQVSICLFAYRIPGDGIWTSCQILKKVLHRQNAVCQLRSFPFFASTFSFILYLPEPYFPTFLNVFIFKKKKKASPQIYI